MLKCLFYRMMLHLTRSFTVACCTRRFSFVKGITRVWSSVEQNAVRQGPGPERALPRQARQVCGKPHCRVAVTSEPLAAWRTLPSGRSGEGVAEAQSAAGDGGPPPTMSRARTERSSRGRSPDHAVTAANR